MHAVPGSPPCGRLWEAKKYGQANIQDGDREAESFHPLLIGVVQTAPLGFNEPRIVIDL